MKAAAVQLNSGADVAANIAAADRHVRAAAADGATLIVLPEKWTAMGSAEQLRAAAEPLDGPAVSWARETASELGVDLVAGSFLEHLEGGAGGRRPASRAPLSQSTGEEKFANTCVHVSASGGVRAVYRKLHMFDVAIDGRSYRESDLELPGEEIVLSETSSGVELGLSICYDLRFPELFRILAVRGARVIALPSAFTLPTTRDHWETLLRARAIENQVFVVAANQVGAHPGDHRSGGRSMIVDPWGIVLAQVPDREGYAVAELDLDGQREIRARFPALANRRPAAYRWAEAEETDGEAESGAADTPAHEPAGRGGSEQ